MSRRPHREQHGPSPAAASPGRKPPLRIGHKGADAIRPGNTLESFEAAVEVGVDVIEFDVLRPMDSGPQRNPATQLPLIVAHDWHDASRREPLSLEAALDAFTRPPLHEVELNLDLKLPGRESELVQAVRAAGLVERAMVSTMYGESLAEIGRIEPRLRRGLTVPRVTRDWRAKRWARPLVAVRLATMRRQLPGAVGNKISAHGLSSMWIFAPLITGRVVAAVQEAGAQTIAWTVDEAERIEQLHSLGVDGVCTNDPRLLQDA